MVQKLKKQQGEATRKQILEVTARRFAQHGYQGTSLEAIAKQVGVAKSSVLWHFGSKEALLYEVIQGVMSKWEKEQTAELLAITDSRERLSKLVDALQARSCASVPTRCSFPHGHVRGHRLEPRADREVPRDVQGVPRGHQARLDLGIQDGVFRKDLAAEDIASFILAGFDGMFIQWYLDRDAFRSRRRAEQLKRIVYPLHRRSGVAAARREWSRSRAPQLAVSASDLDHLRSAAAPSWCTCDGSASLTQGSRRGVTWAIRTTSGSASTTTCATASGEVEFHRHDPARGRAPRPPGAPRARRRTISTSASVLAGRRLQAPLVITGMTGGTAEAARDQPRPRARGRAARARLRPRQPARHGRAPRARGDLPGARRRARRRAARQPRRRAGARRCAPPRCASSATRVGADALCVHLNPAMELVQDGRRPRLPRRRRDHRAARRASSACRSSSRRPAAGCRGARRAALVAARACAPSTSGGAGGTSWVGVEALRAPRTRRPGSARSCGTGASRRRRRSPSAPRPGSRSIATGGHAHRARRRARARARRARGRPGGADAARAAGGRRRGGRRRARGVIRTLRAVMLLCGCRTPGALALAPRVIVGELPCVAGARGMSRAGASAAARSSCSASTPWSTATRRSPARSSAA